MVTRKRNRRRAARHTAAVAAADAAQAAAVPVIVVPPGATLQVVVDVGPMVIPYAIAYDGRTLIKSLVDRSEIVPLTTGDAILAWSFAHAVKGWSHSIGYSLDGAPIKVLEARSEAKRDSDTSVAFALVRS
jgi:hypothetical protein